MSQVLFQQVKVADPGGSVSAESQVDILVREGEIVEMGERVVPTGEYEIAEGGVVSPGWVDLRAHLTDPGEEYKETLGTLAAAAANGGFTTVVTLPNTKPVLDHSGSITALVHRAERLPVRILPTGALSAGAEGVDLAELYDMREAGAIGFTDGARPTANTGLLLRGLQYLKAFDGLLFDFPLEKSLQRSAEVAEGEVATRLGMHGLPVLAETMAVDRALQVLDYFPGRLHLGPLTAAASVERVVAAKRNQTDLSASVSALHLLLSDTAIQGFDPNTKLWPPLRTEADRERLLAGIDAGDIDCIVSNHHPQSIEEKRHDFQTAQVGASTLDIAFSAAWTALDRAGIGLERLVAALTTGPRRILGLPDAHLEVGARIDLTWFDPAADRRIDASALRSRSKFTPVLGMELKGKVKGTLCRGIWRPTDS